MIVGVGLIATNGDFTVFAVPPLAIFWGLLSGIALAYYTIHAGYLLVRLHPLQLVGGSMLVGGILLNFFTPIWSFDFSYQWEGFDLSILAFSILFGTALAFYLYIGSLKYISSKEAGILGLLEPVSAIITSVLVLGVVLGLYQFVGIVMVLAITIFNTLSSGKRGKKKLN
nr:DMT family transporter [Jeotgalicoccus pinnipedialis]